MNGYVTVVYDKKWWIAYVLEKNEELDEAKLTFLHPAGPFNSFFYANELDMLWLPLTDVLCKVHPVTPTGRQYILSQSDTLKVNEVFINH